MKTVIMLLTLATASLAKPGISDSKLLRELLDAIAARGGEKTSAFSAADQKRIVQAHNKYRKSVVPAASDMQDMVWNDKLARLAQEWAEKCKSSALGKAAHGHPADKESVFGPGDIGQNMYWGSTDGVLATDEWYKEVFFYDRCVTSKACMAGKVCGHYTQLAWAKSNQVGCGFAACPGLKPIEGTVVCNYFPGGNSGGPPYQIADSSDCAGKCGAHFCGSNGRPSMYKPQCKCKCKKLYKGNTCSEVNCDEAKDKTFCKYFKLAPGADQCNPANGYSMKPGGPLIPEICPVACGFCKGKRDLLRELIEELTKE